MGILANSPDPRFTTEALPIEEVDSGDGDVKSSKVLDGSAQVLGGKQDKGSHHVSGGDRLNNRTYMDFDENHHQITNAVKSNKSFQ